MFVEPVMIEAFVCTVVPFIMGFAVYMMFGVHDSVLLRLKR